MKLQITDNERIILKKIIPVWIKSYLSCILINATLLTVCFTCLGMLLSFKSDNAWMTVIVLVFSLFISAGLLIAYWDHKDSI